MKYEDHPELVEAAATENGVSVELVTAILRLEPDYRNLHATRPRFRKALQGLVDAALEDREAPSEE